MDLSMPLGLKLDIDDTLIQEYQRMFLSKPVSLLNVHDEMFVVSHYVIQQGFCCPSYLGQNNLAVVPTTTTTTTTEYYSELPKVQPFVPVMPFSSAELKVVQPEPLLEPQNYSPPLESQQSASPPRSAVVQMVVPNTNHNKEVNKSMTGKIKREKRRNTRVLLPYSQSRKKETNFQAYCADFVLW